VPREPLTESVSAADAKMRIMDGPGEFERILLTEFRAGVQERRREAPSCPRCGASESIPVLYGLPTHYAGEAAERGEVLLGGCMLGRPGGDPEWACGECGFEFGVIRR
jgi:hypothetical protein